LTELGLCVRAHVCACVHLCTRVGVCRPATCRVCGVCEANSFPPCVLTELPRTAVLRRAPLVPSLSLQAPEPECDPKSLLSLNSCGLKWHHADEAFALATAAAAAGCLYEMCQQAEHMHAISRRLTASRLVPALLSAMGGGGGGGGDKKKGKGKGKAKLTLSPEQIEATTRIVGCLKFLTMVNANRYRAAQLGAAPSLIQLYEECSNTLLRRNAQSALANIAMLAENGQVLLVAKLPEEFLVPVPMRLTKEEVAELVVEFPNGSLQEAFDKHTKERLDASNAALAAISKKK
jgi:hypothetical protein